MVNLIEQRCSSDLKQDDIGVEISVQSHKHVTFIGFPPQEPLLVIMPRISCRNLDYRILDCWPKITLYIGFQTMASHFRLGLAIV